jgi:UDP-glucose 4-epimerase
VHSLVTGGAGFIGSHLVDRLLAAGDAVTVVDDLSRGGRDNLTAAAGAGAQLDVADVADPVAVGAAFAAARPDRVFHLAAQASVRRSLEDPGHDARTNLVGTINVLEAARRHGVERIVNVSTGGPLYPAAAPLPLSEAQPPQPGSPYGQSKLAAEGCCDLYGRLHDLSTISLRFANVYGPRQDPSGEAGVVAIFAGRLRAGEPLPVFGDGRQTRDFVYVDDAVAALLAAADSRDTGPVNIGTGRQTSILDLIAAFGALRPGRAEVAWEPGRAGERRATSLDASRARARLGWRPRVALREGLELTLHSIAGQRLRSGARCRTGQPA